MQARRLITQALLPVLRRYCPEAEACDLLFFGGRADVCSPLPVKYGLDSGADMVYNIKTGISVGGAPLFSSVRLSGGFLEMTLNRTAAEYLAGPFSARGAEAEMPESFEPGPNADCIKAGLLHAARTSKGGLGLIPEDGEARRALLFTLFADTSASRSIALRACEKVLETNRRTPVLGAGAALACAGAIDAWGMEIKRKEDEL